MKVSGYVTAVEKWTTTTGKPKVSVVLDDNGDKKYPFWVTQRGKPDFIAPAIGSYVDIEYTDDGKYINGVEWAIQRQEPPPPVASSEAQGEAPNKWATLSPKDQIIARMNASNNATALVVARLTAGLVAGGTEQELEHWFQFVLGLLFQGSTIPLAKTDLDVAMEAALAWAETNLITPAILDKFVGAYKTSHNLTTLEVLTLINQDKIPPSVVEVAGE